MVGRGTRALLLLTLLSLFDRRNKRLKISQALLNMIIQEIAVQRIRVMHQRVTQIGKHLQSVG